jgi:hypothetical protein
MALTDNIYLTIVEHRTKEHVLERLNVFVICINMAMKSMYKDDKIA